MRAITLLMMCSLGMGCLTTMPVKMENGRRLMAHPEFEAAIVCPHCRQPTAPNLTKEFLKTIAELEEIIERNGVR